MEIGFFISKRFHNNLKMKQEMNLYSKDDALVWKTLFERQRENLSTKGSRQYLDALNQMEPVLNAHSIPDFDQLNKWFENHTGWKIEVVPGLIPVEDFFELLANKRFCSSTWLRSMDQLDYLEEPDMFHDIFGHIPLLSNPQFSNFAHRFGKLGQAFAGDVHALTQLPRLYWFTIEFGVVLEKGQVKVYGAGIISSFGETNRISANDCTIIPFDIETILQKFFESDVLQTDYFLINDFQELTCALETASINLSRKICF